MSSGPNWTWWRRWDAPSSARSRDGRRRNNPGTGRFSLGLDGEELAETVVGLPHSALHPRLNMPVAVLDRLVLQPARDGRLPVLLIEGRGDEVVMAGQTLPAFGVDHPLRWHDFAVDTRPGVFPAGFVITQHVTPGSTRAQVDLAGRHRRAPRAPPALDVLGLGRRLEDEPARRVAHGANDEFAIRRRGQRDGGLTFHGHVFPPEPSVPADSRRVDPYAPPSSRDIAPPSRRRLSTAPPAGGMVSIAPAVPASPARPVEAP